MYYNPYQYEQYRIRNEGDERVFGPRPYGFGAPFVGGFLGGLLGSAIFPPHYGSYGGYGGYGGGYYGGGYYPPYYGRPHSPFGYW